MKTTWNDRPIIPEDLSSVSVEQLSEWKSRLGCIMLDVQEQLGRANIRVRLAHGHLPDAEYAELCDWQRRARGARICMQKDVARIRQELGARTKLAAAGKTTSHKRTYRDRLCDLLDNLAADEALSEGTRGAAEALLCFIEAEDDERERHRQIREPGTAWNS